MKKALVIGGSNGIGLAISKNLIERGYFIECLDREVGDLVLLPRDRYRYTCCDLYEFDDLLFDSFLSDDDIEVLMITAGIGRIAELQAHHIAEIDKIMTVDATAALKILRIFYDRISGSAPYYTGVMGSISGWISTPAASVYAAAKAAVVRFIESVNIELEIHGTENRILDISPASFPGSRFYGKKNDLQVMEVLAGEITERLFERECLFIPKYEDTFRSVIEYYHRDPHGYGLHSYEYKSEAGRIDNSRKVKIGYLSGTFDLFHVGHINLLKRAKAMCDYLIVGVHESGAWKGKETFVPLHERKDMLAACKYVDRVVDSCREDSDAWKLWHYDRLFVGSDYKGTERFERYENYFKDKNVEIIYFPYTKGTSSTQIRNAILSRTGQTENEEG